MTLVKRTKTWASSSSATVDNDHDSDKTTSDRTLHLNVEVQKLKKARKVCTYVRLVIQYLDWNSFRRPVILPEGYCFPWEFFVRFFLPRNLNICVCCLSVGITLGLIFVKPRDIHAHMAVIMNDYDINLPHLPGLDFSRIEAEWTRLRGHIPELWKLNNDGREFQVGEIMKARGLTAVHPVVLVPGIISTVS